MTESAAVSARRPAAAADQVSATCSTRRQREGPYLHQPVVVVVVAGAFLAATPQPKIPHHTPIRAGRRPCHPLPYRSTTLKVFTTRVVRLEGAAPRKTTLLGRRVAAFPDHPCLDISNDDIAPFSRKFPPPSLSLVFPAPPFYPPRLTPFPTIDVCK